MQHLRPYRKLPSFPPAYVRGFTILELLLASLLGIIVATAAGKGYYSTMQLKRVANERVELQQDLRIAADIIAYDAHMAGRFGCFNLYEGLHKKTNQDNNGMRRAYFTAADLGKFLEDKKQNLKAVFQLDPVFGNNCRWFGGACKNTQQARSQASLHLMAVRKLGEGDTNAPPLGGKKSVTLMFVYGDNSPYSNNKPIVYSTCSTISIRNNDASINPQDAWTYIDGKFNTAAQRITHQNEIAIMNYIVNAYRVGEVHGAQGLYRFQLEKQGNGWGWGNRQLLVKGIKSLTLKPMYTLNCPEKGHNEPITAEQFKLSNDAEDINKYPPSLMRLELKSRDDRNHIIDVLIRNANYCANRRSTS